MKVSKATAHHFYGNKRDEGGVLAKSGGETASIALMAGVAPAVKHPADANEGWAIKNIDKVITDPAVAGTLIGTVPKGAQILAAAMIIQSEGAASGTTATLSIGTDADPDKYCTIGAPTQADSLAKNAKGHQLNDLDSTVLAADEDVQVFPAAAGGTAAGNALSGATVRCVVTYAEFQPLTNYPT